MPTGTKNIHVSAWSIVSFEVVEQCQTAGCKLGDHY